MRWLRELREGDKFFMCATSDSLNGRRMLGGARYTLMKVYAQDPFLRICTSDAEDGVYSLQPLTAVYLPGELPPTEEEVSWFTRKTVTRPRTVGYRVVWTGEVVPLWLDGASMALLKLLFVLGRGEYVSREIREVALTAARESGEPDLVRRLGGKLRKLVDWGFLERIMG